MQFKTPQFIDIEDKIFGPLTFKQFAYLAGGAGLFYLSFRLLPLILGLVVGPAFAALALALAFVKYNEKPFIHTLQASFKFYTSSRLYLWRKVPKKAEPTTMSIPQAPRGNIRDTLQKSKLR